MIHTKTPYINEQLSMSSQRTFPAAPFPRKYVHSVFDELHYAMQAVHALQAAGYDVRDIHLTAGRDYVEAVERRRTLMDFLFSIDLDVYLHEARRGRYILAVHLSSYQQIAQARDLLAPHHAHLIKYIDTWTVTDLSPSPEHAVR